MTLEPVVNSTASYNEAAKSVKSSGSITGQTMSAAEMQMQVAQHPAMPKMPLTNKDQQEEPGNNGKKQPSEHMIKTAVNQANSKIKMQRTGCEFVYHKEINRVSIKVYDKETQEVIREIPPEETLEMVEKMWELAGLLVDEKR